ncbi:vegetative cell wall protein gp1-like [Branchiostoma floridae]|nr:vegetative cell wall protein gp1-like [Branchiostoma floridae]
MQPPRLPYPAIPAMRHPASQPGHPIGPRAPVPNHPAKRPLQPKGPKISIPAEHLILPPAPKAPGKPAERLILSPVPHLPAGPPSPGKAPSPATKDKKKAPYRYLYCPEKCTEIEGNIYE